MDWLYSLAFAVLSIVLTLLSGKERAVWKPGQRLEFNPRFLNELASKGIVSSASEERCAIILESINDRKISVIRNLRIVFQLGLKDALDMAESAPQLLLNDIGMAKANAVKNKLESAGAIVRLEPSGRYAEKQDG